MSNPNRTVFPSPWDGFTGWNSAMMSAADGFQACADACVGWQQEMARFFEARISEDSRSWTALLTSRDLAGAMKVQQEWGLKAMADYTKEATRLARLTTSLSLTGTTPAVQDSAKLIA